MNLEELIARHQEKSQSKWPTYPNRLRKREYRDHYILVREAVLKGIPLWSVIEILRELGAFEGIKTETVWQAFRRALKAENIILSEIEK